MCYVKMKLNGSVFIMEKEKIKLLEDLMWLRNKFNFDFVFEHNTFSQKDIKRYYKKTKYLLYRMVSKDGYMHIGITEDGKCENWNKYQTYQLDRINELIKQTNATNILELGCGQGANMTYLAKQNVHASFTGIDLYPSLDKKNRKYNINLIEGDYHNLEKIESHSVDLVYAIETLCYSTNKNLIFKEVNRILKKGGLFIIFDAYLAKERDSLSEIELIGAKLIENGYYLNEFEYLGNLDKYIHDNNFSVIKAENMKKKVINHLIRYQEQIKKYFRFGFLFKLACKLVPKEVTGNIVPIYFMADTVNMDLSVYCWHILKKK